MLCLSQHIRSYEGLEVQTVFPNNKKNVLAYHNNVDGTHSHDVDVACAIFLFFMFA